QDDIADAYYPYGRNCMLEVAFLASHLLWMTTFSDMEILYDLITRNPAKILRVAGYGLKEGCRADLAVLGVGSVWDAIATQAVPRFVVSGGRVIAETKETTEYHLK
ncbi:MAG: amidohydrolase family protein, partial [Candidatus Hadarchaeales archaeon]